MLKRSSQVALGGVVGLPLYFADADALVFSLFQRYAAAAAAGFLLIAVIVDCGYRWAMLVYLVVAPFFFHFCCA